MMKNFENGIKRAFSEKNEMDYSVDLKGVPDDPKNGIIDDTIIITKLNLPSPPYALLTKIV